MYPPLCSSSSNKKIYFNFGNKDNQNCEGISELNVWVEFFKTNEMSFLKKIKKKIADRITQLYLTRFGVLVNRQRKYPHSIPVIIINYNQLENLRNLVDFLQERKVENIIIIDNKSDYPPLLQYYENIKLEVTIEFMQENYGHLVFFNNKHLQEKYGKGYYFLTDADILPNPNLPSNFIEIMIKKMDRYFDKILKIGFALDLETIPDTYPLKEKVCNWENRFWSNQIEKDVYIADIDTTFALYKPKYPLKFNVHPDHFYKAIRLAGNFTCKHMGWYLDPKNLTEEQIHYMKTSSTSNTWKFDENGNLISVNDY